MAIGVEQQLAKARGRFPSAEGAPATISELGSAVVLGARNLGGAIARTLADSGVRVASVARTRDDLERLRPRGVLPLCADAVRQLDVAEAVRFLATQTGRGLTHELVITPAGERWIP